MSELGDVLELMHTACGRSLNLKASIRQWSDHQLFRQSMERWHAETQDGSIGLLTLDSTGGAPERFSETVYRVWHRRPGPFWRVESESRGKTSVTILNGRRWWSSAFGDTYWTNLRADGSIADNVGGDVPSPALEIVVCPRIVPSITTLQVAGTSRHLNRPIFAVRGRLDVDKRSFGNAFALGAPYADAIDLLVDRATGALLRFSLSLDGQEFTRWEMEEADFAPSLDDSLFLGPSDAKLPHFPDRGRPPGDAR